MLGLVGRRGRLEHAPRALAHVDGHVGAAGATGCSSTQSDSNRRVACSAVDAVQDLVHLQRSPGAASKIVADHAVVACGDCAPP
jgi:hypothetical protein